MTSAPEAMPRHVLERQLRRSRLLNVILAVVAALGLVFGGVQWAQSGSLGEAAAAGQTAEGAGDAGAPQQASLERRVEGDPMAIGDIDAPIVMTEWVDLRCPYCAVFTRDTLPDVVKEYVDSGKVRIEMQDVAFFGEESLRASAAARAAAEQGRYFEFIEAVYEAAPESGHAELTTEELLGHARTAGVPDMELFEKDMARDDLRAAASQATEQASKLGVSGVPFFVVNGQGISGAQPIDTFREFLDQAVTEAS
ncbi:DsbA family protein [Leucobacter salsicius]|uniref:DsbA family protein n=1 Tax=Leucobacter salsicius TaxID=664638 RepID=UPI0012FBF86E|nr:thioredoxin domain-containing protein [Leucobacter salsicius]